MEQEPGGIEQQPITRGSDKVSRVKWCLLGCGIVIVLLILCSALLPAGLTNAARWLADAFTVRSAGEQREVRQANLVEMVVENVGISKAANQPVVLLKQRDGERFLPVWIGLVEMNAISVVTEGVVVLRPLTPDLLCTIMDKLGASVRHIVITDIQDNIFYANIVLNVNGAEMVIDSRPSDAIAIAIRVKTPIYVTEELLDKAGITPDAELEKRNTM